LFSANAACASATIAAGRQAQQVGRIDAVAGELPWHDLM
jgi:hypothetical protein